LFFRGRTPEASIWRRFRASADGFTFLQESDYYSAHVVANAERVVDLFSPAVDVVIEDLRGGSTWKGDGVALPDVREQVAKLKILLARYGGIEFSIFTSEDQLTLNPHLELFIYSRTDRWLYLLEGKGLEEQKRVRTKSWKMKREDFPAAPELATALAAAVERLGLKQPA
jgi:hypothetical protein